MWIPKHIRDRRKGIDTPIPTQAISNEEFYPLPQTPEQRKVEHLINDMADKQARKLGMSNALPGAATIGLWMPPALPVVFNPNFRAE